MIKRLFDLLCSIAGLLLLSPVFLLAALWIKVDSKGSVFYRQERVGRKEVMFKIHKFRTMYLDSEFQGRLTIGADARITRAGVFLRRYKIDELPQLIDVLLGKMSLVGPRPEVKEFMDAYQSDVRNKVLSIRPGITDIASIVMVDENEVLSKYSNTKQAYIDIILPMKQDYYIKYVDSHNMWTDIAIIFLTLKKVIFR